MEPDSIIDSDALGRRGRTQPRKRRRACSAMSPRAQIADAGRVEARVDHHRAIRCGFPEVIFCQGKTPEQVTSIAEEVLSRSDVVLATRASREHADAMQQRHSRRAPRRPRATSCGSTAERTRRAKAASWSQAAARPTSPSPRRPRGPPSSWAARSRASTTWASPACIACSRTPRLLRDARVVIAVAGMEGALPSLVAGLVDVPVVAVPRAWGTARTSAASRRCSRC